MKTCVLTVLTVGLLVGAGVAGDEAKKDKDKLQGTWKAVTMERRGESKDDTQDHRLIFAGDEFTIKRGDQELIKGKFKLTPDQKPRAIDMEITEDPQAENKGKTVQGIYALDGDSLKWCFGEPGGADRPKELSAPAGTKYNLVTFKREKP